MRGVRRTGAAGADATPPGSAGTTGSPAPGWGWTESALSLMVLIWGFNFAIAKHAMEEIEPLAFNALRFVLASAFVFAVLRARGPLLWPHRGHLPRIVLLGLVGNGAYQMAFILGLDRTQAGHAGLMLALTPLLTAILSRMQGHERPGPRTWGGAALSIVGVAMVTGSGFHSLGTDVLIGDLIMIGASVCWAVYTVGAQPLVARYGPVRTTAWTMWTGSVVLVAAGMPSAVAQDWARVSGIAWAALLYASLLSIGLAYLIWYRGVQKLGNTRTAIFSNVTPVIAIIGGALLLGERPGPLALAGAALVLTGIMVVRTDGRTAAPPMAGGRHAP
jgi:drug/metabolite transporter (DMT)-like permease